MASRIDSWSGNSFPLTPWLDDHDQAFDTAQLIADKSVSITVRRGNSTLSAQTIRLETLASQREIQTAGGQTYIIDAMALGQKGHPTLPDTDLKAGDRFAVGGVTFTVVMVQPGQTDTLQAYLEARA